MLQQRHDASNVVIPVHTAALKRVEPMQLSPATSGPTWRRDIAFTTLATIAFCVMLCAMHFNTVLTSTTLPPRFRGQSPSSTPSTIIQTALSSSSPSRHLLVADESPQSPPPGFYDARTPGQRAKARNIWSPFRSAEDKKKRFQQWESDFQQLIDTHHDARVVMQKYLEPAAARLRINAAPMYATNRTVVLLEGRTDPTYIVLLKHMFHLLGPGLGSTHLS